MVRRARCRRAARVGRGARPRRREGLGRRAWRRCISSSPCSSARSRAWRTRPAWARSPDTRLALGRPVRPAREPARPGRGRPARARRVVAPRIVVVGSVNLDLVAHCERLPRAGETVSGADFSRVPGGKGANQAVAAARLGADVRFVGMVAVDDLAEEALAGLEEAGVDTDGVGWIGEPGVHTGVALILVDDDGENQIVVAPGANALHVGRPSAGRRRGCGDLPARDPGRSGRTRPPRQARFFCLNAAPRPADRHRARPARRQPARARGLGRPRQARRRHARRGGRGADRERGGGRARRAAGGRGRRRHRCGRRLHRLPRRLARRGSRRARRR